MAVDHDDDSLGLITILTNYWMHCFRQELKKYFIRAIQKLESFVREYPSVVPVEVVDTVLPNIGLGIREATVCRGQSS